ncbi:TraB/GumN family protein, partial [Acinetobacter baumannii]
EVMVDQRNRAWLPKLRQLLDDGPSFVLVGGAHLAGPGGLPARLQAAGYRVIRVELPARP